MGEKKQDRKGNNSHSAGSIYIIGIGPGSLEHLTLKAKEALESCDAVVGYKTYIDLIKNLISGKEIFSTGMTKEVDRCQKAIELALQGKKVAVVSSGDAGIYGMAGLVFELLIVHKSQVTSHKSQVKEQNKNDHLAIQVIPGVPAFCAAASLLGAPLMHDFASISLSDLLTPWEIIKKRLKMASEGDFVIILYNPKSKTRVSQIEGAIEIISMHRDGNTPVGIVKNALRDGEEIKITTLRELSGCYDFIDMSTILIIGNSATFISNNRMITPRGY
ncbi:MAG: precorrin-3B C(17)-methyltransferase, partial [Deltaproteobacteria bacterium]